MYNSLARKQFNHLLSNKGSMYRNSKMDGRNSMVNSSTVNNVMLNQSLAQQEAFRKSMAYEKNRTDHIIAEAQSLKDRQIARGLVKLNQRRYQLQKLEKERAILGK